ncbi:hypothetical protein GQ457_01G021100 [Hibiscus cannabinus]
MLLWNLWIARNRRIFKPNEVYKGTVLDRSRCMCSALDAEFWTIHEGLECALSLNAENIVAESDNLEVVRSLHNSGARGSYSSLFASIINLLRHQRNVEFRYVFRKGNQVADALAKIGSHQSYHTSIYMYPPKEVMGIFNDAFDSIFSLLIKNKDKKTNSLGKKILISQ